MGYLADKCVEVRNWLAIGPDVYTDAIVTGWIRMAEEQLSNVLRVKHMVQIDTSLVMEERVALPLDWQEIRLVRILPSGTVCRYQTPDTFFNPEWNDPPTAPFDSRYRRYCILGNYVMFGDADPEYGAQIELTYYQNIPPLTEEENTWINRYSPTLYTLKILHIASMYAIEDERSGLWDKEVVRSINDMNAAHKVDMASGSVLMQTRRKTFG